MCQLLMNAALWPPPAESSRTEQLPRKPPSWASFDILDLLKKASSQFNLAFGIFECWHSCLSFNWFADILFRLPSAELCSPCGLRRWGFDSLVSGPVLWGEWSSLSVSMGLFLDQHSCSVGLLVLPVNAPSNPFVTTKEFCWPTAVFHHKLKTTFHHKLNT